MSNEYRFLQEYFQPIQQPTWDDGSNQVLLSNKYFKTRLFSHKNKKLPFNIGFYPPYAGRDGTIVNPAIEMLQNMGFDVYVFDLLNADLWNSCISLKDLVEFGKLFYRSIPGEKIIFGTCMGMWHSLLSLKNEEKPVAQFVFAGPADTSVGEGPLTQKELNKVPSFLFSLPFYFFGVNPGWLQWYRFAHGKFKNIFFDKPLKLYNACCNFDENKISNYHRDTDWYFSPRNLGWWFLDAVDQIFYKNQLKNMIDCYDWPIYIYAGKQDEITPWQCTVALKNFVANGIVHVFEKGGHTLVFTGKDQLNKVKQDLIHLLNI